MDKHALDPACLLGDRLQTLSRAELTALAEALCRILAERGEYHGGIRPDNISRASDGTVGLGAPARTDTKDWTTEELEFMAPEVFWSGTRDASADVYSIGLLLYAAAERWQFSGRGARIGWGTGVGLCAAASAGLAYGAALYALTPLWAVLGSYLLALLACLAAPRIAQPTEYRLEMAGRLLGLRKFIEESELPRIRALAAENPEYFYDVLPYASVFGLEEEWAGRFDGMAVPPPVWYGCSDMTVWNVIWFSHMMHHSVDHSMTQLQQTVAQQSGGGDVQESAHQVQQRGLNGGDHMDAGAQVEGLQAADIVLDVGAQPCTDLVQGLLVVGDPGAQHQMLHILQRLGDLLTAGHLAHAFHTIGIGQDDDVPGEIRCMCAREVQLHAVVTCDRIDLHFFNGRDSHILSPFLLVCALARIISRSLRPRPCVCAVGPDLFFTGTMIPDWHFFDNRGTTQTTGGKSGILHFFSKNEISVSFLFRSVQSCRK